MDVNHDFTNHESAQRVQDFLTRREENNKQYGPESYNHMIDTIDTFDTGEYLSFSDLREVLDELADHIDVLDQIYGVILHKDWGPATRIMRLREIFGEKN